MNWIVDAISSNAIYDITMMLLSLTVFSAIREGYMRFRFGGWRIVIKRGGSVIMEKRTSPYVVKDNQADDYNLTRYAKSMLANAGIWYNGNVYDAITVNALSRVIVVSVP